MDDGWELLYRGPNGHYYSSSRLFGPYAWQQWQTWLTINPHRRADTKLRRVRQGDPDYDWTQDDEGIEEQTQMAATKSPTEKGRELGNNIGRVFQVRLDADQGAVFALGWMYALAAGFHDDDAKDYTTGFASGLQAANDPKASQIVSPGE